MPRLLTAALLLLVALVGPARATAQRNPDADPTGTALALSGFARHAFQSQTEDVVADIDAFWRGWFAAAGRRYASPDVVGFEAAIPTACGPAHASELLAGYCPLDGTIYLAVWFLADQQARYGDYAWINVLAH